jgi:hypothetical protein
VSATGAGLNAVQLDEKDAGTYITKLPKALGAGMASGNGNADCR